LNEVRLEVKLAARFDHDGGEWFDEDDFV